MRLGDQVIRYVICNSRQCHGQRHIQTKATAICARPDTDICGHGRFG